MMSTEKAILILQSIAAIGMAADYYFTELQRNRVNRLIQGYLAKIETDLSTQNDAAKTIINDKRAWIIALVGVVSLIGIWTTERFGKIHFSPMVNNAVFVLLSIVLAISLFNFSFGKMLANVSAVFIITAQRFVISFLVRCPKGTIFGVGSLFLIASFWCRFANL